MLYAYPKGKQENLAQGQLAMLRKIVESVVYTGIVAVPITQKGEKSIAAAPNPL